MGVECGSYFVIQKDFPAREVEMLGMLRLPGDPSSEAQGLGETQHP